MYRHTYLGPYVEVQADQVVKTIDKCQQPAQCPSAGLSAGFCWQCGLDLRKKIVSHKDDKTPIPWDLGWFDMTANQCATGPHYQTLESGEELRIYTFIPNISRPDKPREFRIDDIDGVTDMTALDISGEMEWLRTAFSGEIKYLKENFRQAGICWGLVVWYY